MPAQYCIVGQLLTQKGAASGYSALRHHALARTAARAPERLHSLAAARRAETCGEARCAVAHAWESLHTPSPHGRIAAVEISNVVGRSGGGVDAVGVGTIGAGVKRAGPSLRMRSLRVADASEVRLGLEVKFDQSQESELHKTGRQLEVAARTRCQYRSLRRHLTRQTRPGARSPKTPDQRPISTRPAPDLHAPWRSQIGDWFLFFVSSASQGCAESPRPRPKGSMADGEPPAAVLDFQDFGSSGEGAIGGSIGKGPAPAAASFTVGAPRACALSCDWGARRTPSDQPRTR